MSAAPAELLEKFERLSPEEQMALSAAILKRAAQLDDGEITDGELTATAARMFAILDAEEDASRLDVRLSAKDGWEDSRA